MRERSTFIGIDSNLSLEQVKGVISTKITIAGHSLLAYQTKCGEKKAIILEADWKECCREYAGQKEVEIFVQDYREVIRMDDMEEWIVIDSIIDDEEFLRGLGKDVWRRVVSYAEKRIADEKQRQDTIPRTQVNDIISKQLDKFQGNLEDFKQKLYQDLKGVKADLKFQRLICLMELKSKSEQQEAQMKKPELSSKMASPKSPKIVHYGVSCDVCHMSPITGIRYKSVHKRNYDLCEDCHSKVDSRSDVYIALRECHPSKANHLIHLSRGIVKPGQISSELNLLQHLHQWTDEFVDFAGMSSGGE